MTSSEVDTRSTEMATAYEPGAVEQRIYASWEQARAFRPTGRGADPRPFTIIQPPPNLTGELHVGHALMVAVEDALVRWRRMAGDAALWLPGVDHAAIAVNAIIERQLAGEGLTRHEVGREEFLARVWRFVEASRSRIAEQQRRLGASADWEREAFTMDEARGRAVRETFKRLYDDGLIYRAERLINWDPVSRTAVSDIEVEYRDVDSAFWHVRYPLLDEDGRLTDRSLVIATTRPETIPADSAVAVNPEDLRYADLIGRQVLVPTVDRPVPVVADDAVDMEGGSGVLKVTPGHDPVDFEIGARHDLEIINIMNLDGTLNDAAGRYRGMSREEAREQIVADLDAADLLEQVEPYRHAVGHSERSGAIIEPLVSLQWWVRVGPLAAPAIEVVRNGQLDFVPQRFERTYLHWMENIRDWCISRQIWWGHRIPVWYCDDCAGMTVTVDQVASCESCQSANVRQDEDTLDTWFSSALWPHSTLGWPDEGAEDLGRFYPTQVMETGYDIIFFWVARMIMLSLYNMNGVVPFEHVYLHGLVRAADGSKMSKSRGTSVDPLEAVEEYGADALRFALLSGTSPGNDQRMSDERLEAGRNFANKLWNASRFAIGVIEDGDDLTLPAVGAVTAVEDRWVLSRLNQLTADVEQLLGRFELAEALRQTRDFFWDDFADWYIELAKVRVRAGDRSPLAVLVHVTDQTLRLLHPFMPFVTEEIWRRLGVTVPRAADEAELISARFPLSDGARVDIEADRALAAVREFVRAIRNIRAEKRIDAGRWVEAFIVVGEAMESVRSLSQAIELFGRVRPLHLLAEADDAPREAVVTAVLDQGQVVIRTAGLFDLEAERAKLGRQIEGASGEREALLHKLANEQFTTRAPELVVQRERDRLENTEARLRGLQQSLGELG